MKDLAREGALLLQLAEVHDKAAFYFAKPKPYVWLRVAQYPGAGNAYMPFPKAEVVRFWMARAAEIRRELKA